MESSKISSLFAPSFQTTLPHPTPEVLNACISPPAMNKRQVPMP